MRISRWWVGSGALLAASAALAQVICLPTPAEYRKAVLDRAADIGRQILTDRKGFQAERTALEKVFGQKPKPTIELLGSQNGRAVSAILAAAQRSGLDPELLTAAMAQEGLDMVLLHYPVGTPIDGFSALGVDGFATDMAMLKKGGFLRKDFDGIQDTPGFADAAGNYNLDASGQIAMSATSKYWKNEAGQVYRAFEFKDLEAAAEGMAAYLKYKQSLFFRDAGKLGIDVKAMTPLQLAAWTYLYYNAGEGAGLKLLRKAVPSGVIGKYTRRNHDALRNANRIMAAITQYRDRNLFPDPATVKKCPEPAGSNVSRNASTQGGVGNAGDPDVAQGAGIPRE